MTRALFVIDVQNDFTEGGSLGVPGGAAIAAGISELLARRRGAYDMVFGSRDWHEPFTDNGGHFAVDGSPDFVTTWPVHCIAGTEGAEYHPALDTSPMNVHIKKGHGKPAYSIFEGFDDEGNAVAQLLAQGGVTAVDVVGIATDYCVRASAIDALTSGYQVRVFTDLIVGVARDTSASAIAELRQTGADMATSRDAFDGRP